MVKLILVLRIGSCRGSFVSHIALLTRVPYEASTATYEWRIGILFKLTVISIVVLIGFYTGLFVWADPEQERNTELVATDKEEDEEQREGGEQQDGQFPDPG